MKNIFIGVLISILTTLSILGGARIVLWRKYVNNSSWKAQQSFDYLSEPVYKTKDGQIFTRAQVIDFLMANAIKNEKK